MAPTQRASDDARSLPPQYNNAFDFALTSPPYLNGTNYFRNTKIELWLVGFIKSEDELGSYRRRAIAAGINNVTRDRCAAHLFERAEGVVARLEATGGDRRIPLLVRQYVSDMFEVFAAVQRGLVPDGSFLLDIGDSKFYGVHVPTDRLLVDAAERAGLTLDHKHVLARRHSRDKSELVQVELVFRKPKRTVMGPMKAARSDGELQRMAAEFQHTLPYKHFPYDKRNWGHGLHSLCSYQGKLKPSMAHWLVRHFVPKRGRILDPLGGVGTIPFEAALLGHEAVSNDMSPFAATVALAKLAPPSLAEATEAVDRWWRTVEAVPDVQLDRGAAEFGLNGFVKDFYHPRTLDEVLRARMVFLRDPPPDSTQAFIWASLMHVLHGNRPYALSRTSHPITPFHPKGAATYKSVREKVLQRVTAALKQPLPEGFERGIGLCGDFRNLTREEVGEFHAIITSPPFLGMRFDRPNWLRLWFCGWGENDFHQTSLG
jgi:DNA modification methylase